MREFKNYGSGIRGFGFREFGNYDEARISLVGGEAYRVRLEGIPFVCGRIWSFREQPI